LTEMPADGIAGLLAGPPYLIFA